MHAGWFDDDVVDHTGSDEKIRDESTEENTIHQKEKNEQED